MRHTGRNNTKQGDKYIKIKKELWNTQKAAHTEHSKNPEEYNEPIHEAYENASYILARIGSDIPIPYISYYTDGGVGLEWRPRKEIATISIYGDDIAIYTMTDGDKNAFSGNCHIKNEAYLTSFFTAVRMVYEGKTQ